MDILECGAREAYFVIAGPELEPLGAPAAKRWPYCNFSGFTSTATCRFETKQKSWNQMVDFARDEAACAGGMTGEGDREDHASCSPFLSASCPVTALGSIYSGHHAAIVCGGMHQYEPRSGSKKSETDNLVRAIGQSGCSDAPLLAGAAIKKRRFGGGFRSPSQQRQRDRHFRGA